MSRRSNAAAAAAQASEAARVLQARSQEVKAEAVAEPESRSQPAPSNPDRVEKLRQSSPHRVAMEEMVQRDLERRGIKEEPAPEETAPPEPPAQEEPKVEEQPPAEAAPAEPPVQEAPKTVRVKVDGEEFEAPADEVEEAGGVKAYQIQKAAENRLKKANEAVAQAKQVAEFMMRQAQPVPPPKPQETDAQFIAERIDKVRFGTPEEAAAAQLEILQRTQQRIDPNDIIEAAANRIKHDAAVAEFDKEFVEISANPLLLKLVVAMRHERLEKHRIEKPNQPIDWHSFYRTIGNEVRSVAGRPSQPASAPAATSGTPSQPSDKEARKASIVNLPAAAARAEPPKEQKPETREDVINEMKRRRGIPVG